MSTTSVIASIKGGGGVTGAITGAIPGANTVINIGGVVAGLAKKIDSLFSHRNGTAQHHEPPNQTAAGQNNDLLLDAIQLATITDEQYHRDFPPAWKANGIKGYSELRASGKDNAEVRSKVDMYLGTDVSKAFDDPATAAAYRASLGGSYDVADRPASPYDVPGPIDPAAPTTAKGTLPGTVATASGAPSSHPAPVGGGISPIILIGAVLLIGLLVFMGRK